LEVWPPPTRVCRGHALDDRHELLVHESLAGFATLPDVEDPQVALVMVEALGVSDQSFGERVDVELCADCVVVLRAGVAVDDENSWT
jgi:hypothetical protein